MKVSELWLKEWLPINLTHKDFSNKLTMSGFEVESINPVANEFSNVFVGKIIKQKNHPKFPHLTICDLDIGKDKPFTIVSGAKNIKVGKKFPVAIPGAILPNKIHIESKNIEDIESQGMLCSALELGLAEVSDNLFELSDDAPIGISIWDYLLLSDFVFDIAITPNRGDCLSMLGMAREIAALTESQFNIPNIKSETSKITDILPIKNLEPIKCPHYVGRIIKNVKSAVITPIWIQERLRRAGVRVISPIVDIMNYVMIELGQPLHAFDLDTIDKEIVIRNALSKEELLLLDGSTCKLTNNDLVIADSKKPLALAGIMGGLDSSVTLFTKNIFLESAYFKPHEIAKNGRAHGLVSESSYRFERNVDPELQKIAIKRATDLILEICGGDAGPIIENIFAENLPQIKILKLRKNKLDKILGIEIPVNTVDKILNNLNFTFERKSNEWQIKIPTYRADLSLEEDLIEEIARLYGYDKIPLKKSAANLQINSTFENKVPLAVIRRLLCDLGYNEVITYSFIDQKTQTLFDPDNIPLELANPISSDMNVMRTNLWPGLVKTLLYNQNRQQNRVRLFEIGLRFIATQNGVLQQRMLSGLISDLVFPEQWGIPKRENDFFDLKGDLENLLKLTLNEDVFSFKTDSHPALHPGQTAAVYKKDKFIGYAGALHPNLLQTLDILGNVFVFELALDDLEAALIPHYQEISRFPEIRRDLAILIDRTIPSKEIQDTILSAAGKLLKKLNIFDVYMGKGVSENHKSIALSLILQDQDCTLRDEEVAELMERVITVLKEKFGATLRS